MNAVTPGPEGYVEAVLAIVESVPRGRVTTFGAVADALFDEFGGGPRTVGTILTRRGRSAPWWRVVRADGTVASWVAEDARQAWLDEGTPMRRPGAVDLPTAFWLPG